MYFWIMIETAAGTEYCYTCNQFIFSNKDIAFVSPFFLQLIACVVFVAAFIHISGFIYGANTHPINLSHLHTSSPDKHTRLGVDASCRKSWQILINAGPSPCAGKMLGHRRRRWPNINPTQGHRRFYLKGLTLLLCLSFRYTLTLFIVEI